MQNRLRTWRNFGLNRLKDICTAVFKRLEYHSQLLSALSSVVTIIGLPLAIVGLYFAYVQISDRLQPPEVGLLFSRPERVVFRIVNTSKTLARDIWYQLAFMDLDALDRDGLPLDLEIKGRHFDYASPKESLGPWSLIELSPHATKISNGHRLFGWASVKCSECIRRIHYWVFIEHDKGGWYSEIDTREERNIVRNLQRVLKAKDDTPLVIADVAPQNRRTTIGPLDWDADFIAPAIRKDD